VTFDDALHLLGIDVTFEAFMPLEGEGVTFFWASTLTCVDFWEDVLMY
jgi:hypothetical protein